MLFLRQTQSTLARWNIYVKKQSGYIQHQQKSTKHMYMYMYNTNPNGDKSKKNKANSIK
jgi:hypothetical protein